MNLDWMKEAKCKNKTSLFFPNPAETAAQRRKTIYSAKAICRTCPVLLDCRDYARKNNELGIWGGETEDERFMSGFLNHPVVNRRLGRARRRMELESRSVE